MRMLLSFGLLAAFAAAAPVAADELQVTPRSAPAQPADAPSRGMHQDAVLRRWGEPQQRIAAVGGGLPQHPPISRWVYPAFTVYFERELVITSVGNRPTAAATPAN
jgi:hypothetical protein